MAELPSGTVTFLFTDIEGSTRLWETQPEAMAVALKCHDELLRSAIGSCRGHVFKTVGDAFCATFPTASDGVAAALMAQRALGGEPWPEAAKLRVRMALHTGSAEERDGDYFGPVVNRSARLEAAAHGGQVLLSGSTASLVEEVLPEGVALRDLGSHRLKDLGRPEQIFELHAEGLQSTFPPLRTLDNPELPNNLPQYPSSFVGRTIELAEVRSLVCDHRLVTVAGAGGSGKTRLALQVAAELLDGTGEGVWFVDLAPVDDPRDVPGAIEQALGIRAPVDSTSADALVEVLRPQDILIVLDNCEHVVDACAELADLVHRRCPRVHLLATSREPLGIDGERVYRMRPLSCPADEVTTAQDLEASEAVQLFVERARNHDGEFTLTDALGPLVASICRRVDGIPFAIELAAARLASMSIADLDQRLDQRFRLLTGGNRTALPRQRTLQATVDWSFDLLTMPEQVLLRRLAVFVSSFELAAAEAVCTDGDIDVFDVSELLGSLVNKSLVVADRTEGELRYRLLETIRQYAADQMARTGGAEEATTIQRRHAEYYLALAASAGPELRGPAQVAWLRRLDQEWDNLRVALAYLSDRPDRTEDVLRLCTDLHWFLYSRSHLDPVAKLRTALDRAVGAPTDLVAEAYYTAAHLVGIGLGFDVPDEISAGRGFGERALDLAIELDDPALVVEIKGLLSFLAQVQKDDVQAKELAEEALEGARTIGDPALIGRALEYFSLTFPPGPDQRPGLTAALEYQRRVGDTTGILAILHRLGVADLVDGDPVTCRQLFDEVITLAEEVGSALMLGLARGNQGVVLLLLGEAEEAERLSRQALVAVRRLGRRWSALFPIFVIACCATLAEDFVRGAQLTAAHDALAADEGVLSTWAPLEIEARERNRDLLRAALSAEEWERLQAAGAAMDLDAAIDLALGRI